MLIYTNVSVRRKTLLGEKQNGKNKRFDKDDSGKNV